MQFKNMNELMEYLGTLEERIKTLEAENHSLRAIMPRSASVDENAIAKYVSRSLPQTGILSPSFFTRAFAIWGHFFVANFGIGLIFGLLYMCLILVGLAAYGN